MTWVLEEMRKQKKALGYSTKRALYGYFEVASRLNLGTVGVWDENEIRVESKYPRIIEELYLPVYRASYSTSLLR